MGKTLVALGNRRVDQEACTAALWAPSIQPRAVTTAINLTPLAECVLHYFSHECEWSLKRKENIAKEGGIRLQTGE
jgi:hypothetical protein